MHNNPRLIQVFRYNAITIAYRTRTNVFSLFAGIIPAYLKKNDDRMPCAALLQIRNIVAFECPSRMLKLLGPEKKCT